MGGYFRPVTFSFDLFYSLLIMESGRNWPSRFGCVVDGREGFLRVGKNPSFFISWSPLPLVLSPVILLFC